MSGRRRPRYTNREAGPVRRSSARQRGSSRSAPDGRPQAAAPRSNGKARPKVTAERRPRVEPISEDELYEKEVLESDGKGGWRKARYARNGDVVPVEDEGDLRLFGYSAEKVVMVAGLGFLGYVAYKAWSDR